MNFSNAVSAAYSAWSVLSFILAVIGALSLVALAVGAISRLGKATWRFGLALYGKKIMIVSDGDDYRDLEEDLSSSGLIKKKNVLIYRTNSYQKPEMRSCSLSFTAT